MTNRSVNFTYENLKNKTEAFNIFRLSYRKNEAMNENKELLKEKFARGKELGNIVNESRNRIK